MPFQNCNGIMQRKTHCNRKKCKKHQDVFQKLLDSSAINGFISKPITNKKDNSAYYEKTHHIEIHLQMFVFVFDVKHRNTQNSDNQNVQKHSTVEQMQKTVYFGFERNIGAFENTPCHFLKIFSPAFVPTELLRTRRTYYNRKLRGSFHRFQIFEFPLFKLRSVAEVQIFR